MKTRLTLVRILTVFIVTSAVILSNSSTVQGTPLFFDFLKRTFGGKGKAPKPASNQRPQGSAWATGGQYQKEKKFPWDIFGIFGYKNVIRPNNRPRPQRPGPPYRPPRFLVLHVKTYHIQTLCSKWEIYYRIVASTTCVTIQKIKSLGVLQFEFYVVKEGATNRDMSLIEMC